MSKCFGRLELVDAIEYMKGLSDESIDLVITDPPYLTTKRGRGKEGTTTSGGMCEKKDYINGNVFKYNSVKPEEYIPELFRLLKDGTHCYIMTNQVNLYSILTVAKASGFHFIKSLIWNKGNKIMSQAYMSQFEYVLFFRKGKFKKINKCGTSDILNIPNKKTKGIDGKNIHDTEKPIDLMKVLVENSSNEGDLVFDPFSGVGSSLIACKELNRIYLGCEIDVEYFEIAQERIRRTGGKE